MANKQEILARQLLEELGSKPHKLFTLEELAIAGVTHTDVARILAVMQLQSTPLVTCDNSKYKITKAGAQVAANPHEVCIIETAGDVIGGKVADASVAASAVNGIIPSIQSPKIG